MSLGSVFLELPNVEELLMPLVNGECRFLSIDAAAQTTDDQGFLTPLFTESNTDFYPCTWVGKKIDESLVADQTRSLAGYEITLLQNIGGNRIEIDTDKRVELRLAPNNTEVIVVEIIALINQMNLFWQIFAIDSTD